MTKVVGCLSFFDENPVWLRNLPVTLKKTGVSHLVALDGRYSLFPSEHDRSPSEQIEALQIGCATSGVELTLEQGGPYEGNEVEKRSGLFQLAETVTSGDDWYMVIDADTYVQKADKKLVEKLADSTLNVATVRLMDGTSVQCDEFRALFRALRGLRCDTNHYTYRAGDHLLWADPAREHLIDPSFHTDVVFQHLNRKRDPARTQAAKAYYKQRQAHLIEYGACQFCDEADAVLKVPAEWYWAKDQLRARWYESCRSCALEKARGLPQEFVGLGASREAAQKVLAELFA